jgi:hypothetical protein
MPDRSRGRSQTKRDTPVLQVWGLGVRLTVSHVTTKLFKKPESQPRIWRQIVQKAKAHPEL